MIIGIVGSEQAKFTPETEEKAREVIREHLKSGKYAGVTSGECPLGGVDYYAREEAARLNLPFKGFPPAVNCWDGTRDIPGFKQRNISIAELSDLVLCITIKTFPPSYTGRRFTYCYHCQTSDHIKSGGCWTMHYAIRNGKKGELVVVE